MDVTLDEAQMKEKIDNLTLKYGCIDILINNAGISYRGEVKLSIKFFFINLLLSIISLF